MRPRVRPSHPKIPRKETPSADKTASKITKDMVTNKFLKARRLYTAYKTKNGGRLDGEYNELMIFLQYDKPQAERMHRIEAFMAKIPKQ